MKIFRRFISTTVSFLAGCTIHPKNGFYEGYGAAGWAHSTITGTGGANEYTPIIESAFRLRVTFSTTERGELYMNVNSYPESPDFGGRKIVVKLNNGRTQMIEAKQSVSIKVGDSQSFTVTVPEFSVAGVNFVPIEASFKWNESTKYYVRSLQ